MVMHAMRMESAASDVMGLLKALGESRGEEIRAWMDARAMESGAPFYASVDVRHAGYKLAPVDTNLFPAGFNQLSMAARSRAAERIRHRLTRYHAVNRVLVIPENHTRNTGYIDNLSALTAILREAGCAVELGSLGCNRCPDRGRKFCGRNLTPDTIAARG